MDLPFGGAMGRGHTTAFQSPTMDKTEETSSMGGAIENMVVLIRAADKTCS